MHIHRVQGSSLKDALLRARRAHGSDAIVVQHEIVAGGDVALALVRPSGATPRVDAPAPRPDANVKPGLHELAGRLQRHGASRAFADEVCARVEARFRIGVHAMDVAAEVLGEMYPAVRCPKLPGVTRVLAFVGAPGSGKTQTMIKLAWKMRAAGRHVELAMLEDQRPGAYQQLAAWAATVKVPLSVLDESVELRESTRTAIDCVLVDSTGDPSVDAPRLRALQQSLVSESLKWETHVVLSATEKVANHDLVLESHAVLAPSGIAITKLDRANDPASVLEYAHAREIPVSFLCNGESLVASLHRADPALIADLFLCGRIS